MAYKNGNDVQKRKRGNSPVKFIYIGDGGEDNNKPTASGNVVVSFASDDRVIEFSLNALNTETIRALAIEMVAKKIETYIRNHYDEDNPNAYELTSAKLNDIRAGKLFTRAASKGNGNGRKADVTPIVEALRRAYDKRKKPLNDDQLAELRFKLEAMSGRERQAKITELKRDPVFKYQYLQVMMEASKKSLKDAAQEVDLLAKL